MSYEQISGPLPAFADTLIKDRARTRVPLPELLRPATLDRLLLQTYGAALVHEHMPLLVSQWFKFYAMQLIPPVVTASLTQGEQWPLQPDQLWFALDERGVLDGVRFSCCSVVSPQREHPFERFAPLLDNLAQVIDALCAYGRLAPAVLWSSAGDVLETCLRQLSAVTDVPLAPGYGLLRERLMPDGRRNPLFDTLIYIEGPGGQAIRKRRTCCLSYRVAWVGRCEHCPVNEPPNPA